MFWCNGLFSLAITSLGLKKASLESWEVFHSPLNPLKRVSGIFFLTLILLDSYTLNESVLLSYWTNADLVKGDVLSLHDLAW